MINCAAEPIMRDKTEGTASASIDSAETTLVNIAEQAAKAARFALQFELELAPKPGLVDSYDPGSHPDMTMEMFYNSAKTLEPFFASYWLIGATHKKEEIFPALRSLGLEAEAAMIQATGGKNTHKGAHFCFALVLAAASYGRCHNQRALPAAELERLDRVAGILSFVPSITGNLVTGDLEKLKKGSDVSDLTAGERIYRDYSIGGIREEASSGFPTITRYGLNLLESHAYAQGESICSPVGGILAGDRKLALDYLMTLLTKINDTTLIKRGGFEGLEYAQGVAKSYLRHESQSPEWEEALQSINGEFICRNLSPGGAADLLAVTHLTLSLAVL
ncbi:MAG TPA: hypothetical protein GXZ59_06560 [Clostridiaceae bacterium]|nr:hypothetical protein [Clostridiaceae bacterium]